MPCIVYSIHHVSLSMLSFNHYCFTQSWMKCGNCLNFKMNNILLQYLYFINSFYLLTIFAKHSILNVWQGSEYAFGLLMLFCYGSKRDTQECLIYTKLFIVFTPNSDFSHYSEVIHGSTTFKVTKAHDVWYFCSFILFIPMSQT